MSPSGLLVRGVTFLLGGRWLPLCEQVCALYNDTLHGYYHGKSTATGGYPTPVPSCCGRLCAAKVPATYPGTLDELFSGRAHGRAAKLADKSPNYKVSWRNDLQAYSSKWRGGEGESVDA